MQIICAGELGVNAYLLWDERRGEAAVIDVPDEKPILAALREKGVKLTHILLTHGHYDHIAGVRALKEATGADISIHSLDADMLTDPTSNLSIFMTALESVQLPADTLLTDGGEIEAGGVLLRVMHTPGHSRGSVCFVGGDMVFTGDTLFYRSVGRFDLPHSNAGELRRSVAWLMRLPPAFAVYPGHMRSTSIAFERAKNPFARGLEL